MNNNFIIYSRKRRKISSNFCLKRLVFDIQIQRKYSLLVFHMHKKYNEHHLLPF